MDICCGKNHIIFQMPALLALSGPLGSPSCTLAGDVWYQEEIFAAASSLEESPAASSLDGCPVVDASSLVACIK